MTGATLRRASLVVLLAAAPAAAGKMWTASYPYPAPLGLQAPVSTGIGGRRGTRSAPTVLNAAYMTRDFWDGRAADLEEQALAPIANPAEMGFTHDGVVRRLSGIAGYAPLFKAAFGDGAPSIERVGMAIASFERTVLTGDSPYDRWKAGDKGAMSPAAVRGYAATGA